MMERRSFWRILLILMWMTMCLLVWPGEAQAAGGDCGKDVHWTFEDGVLRVWGTGAIEDHCASESAPWRRYDEQILRAVVEAGVTKIGDEAFKGCKYLLEVQLPEGLLRIGEQAFYGCEALTQLAIPGTVETVGKLAFGGCTALTRLTITGTDPQLQTDGGGLILSKDGKKVLMATAGVRGTYQIPEGVESIGEESFTDCSGLTELLLPDSLRRIEQLAFAGYLTMEKICFPEGLEYIGRRAFDGASKLEKVVFRGRMPMIDELPLGHMSGVIYYPKEQGWTDGGRWEFGSSLRWKSYDKATIRTQPQDVWALQGKTAQVTLEATGRWLQYQWYYADAGETEFRRTDTFKGGSYSVKMDDARSGRRVYCVVTDDLGNSVRSETVTLHLGDPADAEPPQQAPETPSEEPVEPAAGEILLRLHYHRPDGKYKGWQLWARDEDEKHKIYGTHARDGHITFGPWYAYEQGEDDVVFTLRFDAGVNKLGYALSYGEWEDKDVLHDQVIDLDGILGGTVDIYVESGVPTQPASGVDNMPDMEVLIGNGTMVLGPDVIRGVRLREAYFTFLGMGKDSRPTVFVYFTGQVDQDLEVDSFRLICDGEEVPILKVENNPARTGCRLTLEEELQPQTGCTIAYDGWIYKVSTSAFPETPGDPVPDPEHPAHTEPTEPPAAEPTEPPVTEPTGLPATEPTEPPATEPTEEIQPPTPTGSERAEPSDKTDRWMIAAIVGAAVVVTACVAVLMLKRRHQR